VYALLLSGCATSGALGREVETREPTAHANVTFASVASDEAVRLVPQAIEPLLPSADRIARVVDARLGGEAKVDVRYCVSPAGTVVEATLERGSSLEAFDQAVMADVAGWRFDPQPGPGNVRSCQSATIVYRPHGS